MRSGVFRRPPQPQQPAVRILPADPPADGDDPLRYGTAGLQPISATYRPRRWTPPVRSVNPGVFTAAPAPDDPLRYGTAGQPCTVAWRRRWWPARHAPSNPDVFTAEPTVPPVAWFRPVAQPVTDAWVRRWWPAQHAPFNPAVFVAFPSVATPEQAPVIIIRPQDVLLLASSLSVEQQRAAVSLVNRHPKIRHGVDVLSSSDIPTGETLRAEIADVTWSYRPLDRVTGQTTDVAAARRTASLTAVGPQTFPLSLRRYRPWTDWLTPDGWVRFYMGVFLATLPPRADDGLVVRDTLNLADKTYRLANTFLVDPVTVDVDVNPVQWVKDDLTSRFGETAFSISSTTVTLVEPKTFEAGDTWLSVYDALLQLAAFDGLSFDDLGRPMSVPLADIAGRGSSGRFAPGAGKIMTAGSVEPLLPSLYNQVRFVARQGPSLPEEGNGMVTVSNQSTGPASIDGRGGEIVAITVEVDAEGQEQLEEIALADAQRFFAGGGLRFVGQIGLNPRLGDREVIELGKPRLELDGMWLVTSWTYPMHPIVDEGAVLMAITCEQRVVVS